MFGWQVIEFGDIAKVDAKGDPLEASLMLGLKHANIVETIEHKTQQVQVQSSCTLLLQRATLSKSSST